MLAGKWEWGHGIKLEIDRVEYKVNRFKVCIAIDGRAMLYHIAFATAMQWSASDEGHQQRQEGHHYQHRLASPQLDNQPFRQGCEPGMSHLSLRSSALVTQPNLLDDNGAGFIQLWDNSLPIAKGCPKDSSPRHQDHNHNNQPITVDVWSGDTYTPLIKIGAMAMVIGMAITSNDMCVCVCVLPLFNPLRGHQAWTTTMLTTIYSVLK